MDSDCSLSRIIDMSHIKEIKTIVIASFKIRMIDEWTNENILELLLDEKVIKSITSITVSNHLGHKCGDPTIKDGIQEVSLYLNPDLAVWNIKIKETKPGPVWGIFDFEIWTSACPENSNAINKEQSMNMGCICNSGFYSIVLSNVLSCVRCSHGCTECTGPDSCSACTVGYIIINQKCLIPGNEKIKITIFF
jgi:hypothetical protein